jgi:serine/threonine-protein kinase RsbW
MIDHRPRLRLTTGPPANSGDRCGSWPLQLAPQLTKVRASVEALARGRYAHPSLDAPEPSLLGVLERLALVVSELGGNALRHAHAPVTVSLSRLPRGWLLNVSDGDPDTAPLVEPAEGDQGRRHGLQVVSIVSADVGWYAEDGHKHVWAVVPDRTPEDLAALVRPGPG